MATLSDLRSAEMSFVDMLSRLEAMAKPVINDKRQAKYCHYITMFLSHFGKERCLLTGSTIEKTRLRLNKDEGDFDYLAISGIVIPIECVEYREDIPSFIHIDARQLQNIFPTVQLIDDKYLPSTLLSEMKPHAFKHLRDIYHIVKGFDSMRGRHTLSVALNEKIKLGTCLQIYRGIKCYEIPTSYRKPLKDSDKIRENVRKCLKDKPAEFSENVLSSIRAMDSLVNEYNKVFSASDNPSRFQQSYGPFLSAIGNGENIQHTAEKMSPELKRPKLTTSGELVNIATEKSGEAMCSSEQNEPLFFEKNSMTKNYNHNKLNFIKIQFEEKSSKDFIPCFPLSGKPKHMDDWKIRQRASNWPGQDVIDDIYDSEFFVVAKPAIYQPETHKDFCLAYNIPEKKLARAMTLIQKHVLLIIKAIHKSFLAKFCDEITTFHWKTALYWESECVEPSLLEKGTEKKNVQSLLQRVLERMAKSLSERVFVHYFNSTNLFVGKDTEVMLDIGLDVLEIHENHIELLRLFFREQKDGKLKEEWIPRERIAKLQKHDNDIGDNDLVTETLAILEAFSRESKDKIEKALTDVLTNALPFLIEENTRGKSPMIQNAITKNINRDSLVKDCVSLLLGHIYSRRSSAEKIVRQFETLCLQNMPGNLSHLSRSYFT